MRVEINVKNYHLDNNFSELIIKKLGRFDKYFNDNAKAKVKLSTQNKTETMEITISFNGNVVRSVNTSDDMKSNLDVVLPKLERQIIKHKNRFTDKMKKTAFETPALYEEKDLKDETRPTENIVKVKKFQVSVTTVENAAEEMELLSHSFYVFINGETNKVNILYRRNDGNLGLIEPEY